MDLSQIEFELLRDRIYDLCGLIIDDNKKYLIKQRLEPLARLEGCASFTELYGRLQSTAVNGLGAMVIDAMTTNETSFFRDGHPFVTFQDHILPRLAARLTRGLLPGMSANRQARIWSVASSTGQEPYSLAMLIDEFLGSGQNPGLRLDNFSILATDISRPILQRAMAGTYTRRELERGVATLRINRHFLGQGDLFTISPALRQMVEFRQLNLVQPFPNLGVFDVIFCRNVLIYFDEPTRKRIFAQFQRILHAEGILVLGATESTYGMTDAFVSERFGPTILYRKNV